MRIRVAYVDDEPFNHELLDLVNEETGRIIQVDHFTNGMDFLDARLDQYDVFLLDFHMPIMDGVQVHHELRARGFTQPIAFYTSDVEGLVEHNLRVPIMRKDVSLDGMAADIDALAALSQSCALEVMPTIK